MQPQTIEDEKQNFVCEICSYSTNRKSSMDKHLSSLKHVHKKENKNTFECTCGNNYMHNTSLSRHRKKCSIAIKELENQNSKKMCNLVLDVVQKQTELIGTLQNQVLELTKASASSITNNINNINNTKFNNCGNFNINIFLNEQCKDAINLSDFVNSLQVKLKDLEETARLGYSEGVSKIFINGLNELEVNKRPIHCSDAKRETLYIKNQNEWTKDADKTLLTNAIKTVGKKNIQQIFEWQKKYPEYNDPASRQNDKYLKMLCNAMNGSTDDEQEKNMEKIIRNITKEVIIDKNISC